MNKSDAMSYLEQIEKPKVNWLERCIGDRRLTESCAYGMGYSEAVLEKAIKAHQVVQDAERQQQEEPESK